MHLRPSGSTRSFRAAGLVAALALLAAPSLTACSSDDATSADATTVSVTASDTACELSIATVPAGSTTFEAKNTGSQVTEVYVYRPDATIVTEKENIGPGTSATFSADLAPGDYEVACKPGQKGDGIRVALKATGTSTPTTTSKATGE